MRDNVIPFPGAAPEPDPAPEPQVVTVIVIQPAPSITPLGALLAIVCGALTFLPVTALIA